ncbi:MAG: hypothetical protein ACFFBE_09290 [Promethearchaeota archaeon]
MWLSKLLVITREELERICSSTRLYLIFSSFFGKVNSASDFNEISFENAKNTQIEIIVQKAFKETLLPLC